MGTFWKSLKSLAQKHPLPFQMLSTGVLMGTGDVLAQTVVEGDSIKNLNYVRTAQFFAVGTVVIAPALATWYRILHHYVGSGGKPMTRSMAIKKVALDQILFAPFCIAGFILAIETIQMRSFEDTKSVLKHNYLDIMKNNYKIWPLVQFCNFFLVPVNYQVVVVQFVAIFWNAYLSYKTSPKQH